MSVDSRQVARKEELFRSQLYLHVNSRPGATRHKRQYIDYTYTTACAARSGRSDRTGYDPTNLNTAPQHTAFSHVVSAHTRNAPRVAWTAGDGPEAAQTTRERLHIAWRTPDVRAPGPRIPHVGRRRQGGDPHRATANRSRPTRGRTRSQCRTKEQTVNQLLDQRGWISGSS